MVIKIFHSHMCTCNVERIKLHIHFIYKQNQFNYTQQYHAANKLKKELELGWGCNKRSQNKLRAKHK